MMRAARWVALALCVAGAAGGPAVELEPREEPQAGK